MSDPDFEALKLHPMTLLQRVILSLPGYVVLLFYTWTAPDESNLVSLVVTVIYAVVALPIIYLRFARFRYWITDTELVIKSGVLTRQHRNIPLEKIQNVEIVQRLLPRLTGTAQVEVVTAGSSGAEGVLQFVSLKEAHRIREVVRRYNRADAIPSTDDSHAEFGQPQVNSGLDHPRHAARTDLLEDRPVVRREHAHDRTQHEQHRAGSLDIHRPGHISEAGAEPTTPLHPDKDSAWSRSLDPDRIPLYAMSLKRVLLSGVFRFSLLYIAVIFSALQFFQPDPEKLLAWVLRSNYDPFIDSIRNSPISSAALGIFGAGILSWGSGIVVNLNKYFGFTLWKEGSKLGKRSGLLTLAEGTIPLRKIQALVFETNPVREAAGFNALRAQTMGLDANESGHRVVVPFARFEETAEIAQSVIPLPLPNDFTPVSKKRIMRLFVRYSLALLGVIGVLSIWYSKAVWLVFLSPALLALAYLQWKRHAYAVIDHALVVKRGLIKRRTWMLPVEKMQVFYTTESFFQRRRGLKSVYVDSAGSSSVGRAVVIDMERNDAALLSQLVYGKFRRQK